jgi:hypothetical protein
MHLTSVSHFSKFSILLDLIQVMHLNTFDMKHIIYVWDSFFNVNSIVMFVSSLNYLIWQLFWECLNLSVAMAIANVFRNNGISMGRNLARILKIFEKIYETKSRGVIYGT